MADRLVQAIRHLRNLARRVAEPAGDCPPMAEVEILRVQLVREPRRRVEKEVPLRCFREEPHRVVASRDERVSG